MKKLSYVTLGLIGIMGALSVGVASAETTVSDPYGSITYSLTGHEGTYNASFITIDDGTTKITILDRNLGATTAGTGCEDRDYVNHQYNPLCNEIDNTYGYLFQWGNNYGFPSHGELSSMSSTSVSSPIDIPYSSSTFITGHNNWMNDNSVVNLWGGTTNDSSYSANNRQITNAQERQGPCPDGFHVPSAGELYKLHSMFDNKADIHEKLLIPFAGYRKGEDGSLVTQGYWIGLMSSSINPNQTINYNLLVVNINNGVQSYMHQNPRSTAQSVRCFYNQYTEYSEPEPVQEITNINISGIVDPVLGEYPVTGGITITSTPEGAVHIANSWWSDFNGQTLCNPMGICSNDRDTSYFSNQDSAPNKKYYLVINYVIDDGYELADNATITTNGNGTVTTPKTGFVQLTYNASDLQAAPAPTEISEISITGITLPVGGAMPTTEGIRSLTTGITVEQSNNGAGGDDYTLARVPAIGWTPVTTAFTAGQTYRIVIPFSIANGYELAYPLTIRAGDLDADENIVNTRYQVFGFSYTATEPTVTPTTYTVTWKNGETVLETDENVAEGATPSYDGTTPKKAATSSHTYTFKGWSKDGTNVVNLTTETITSDTTYIALFNEKKKNTSSSSSSSSNKTGDNNTGNTNSGTNNTGTVETGINNNEKIVDPTDPQAVQANGYTNEINEAYEFAFANGITTMQTIEEAAIEEGLTRIAMAKMLSQYAINVLKKTPDTSKECKFGDVSAELDAEYVNGVTLACQLGIMGVGITDFRPFDPVVRAEFGTALSRLLFRLADGEEAYYTTHLAKLKEAGIISNDDPTLEELRGYVMLMLMRSAK